MNALTGSDLSRTLNLSDEEGERWIVNLIRDSRMGVDAKIDLESVCGGLRAQLISEHAAHHPPAHHSDGYIDRNNTRSCLSLADGSVRYAEPKCRAERRGGAGRQGEGQGPGKQTN